MTDRQADSIAAAERARDIVFLPGQPSLLLLLAELHGALRVVIENGVRANEIASEAQFDAPEIASMEALLLCA